MRTSTPRPVLDRLGSADLMMLWADDFGCPEDIGALAVLDGRALGGADGVFPLAAVRRIIESRLPLVPRFRQVLYRPRRGLGDPLWLDAPSFRIEDHVDVLPLEEGADPAVLLRAVERLRRVPFDEARPRWRLTFLPGLPAGRIGLVMRLHHAIADGMAGVALLGAFLDADPGAGAVPAAGPAPWIPAPWPTDADLLADNVRRRAALAGEAVEDLVHPVATVRRVATAARRTAGIMREYSPPATSLNAPVGPERTVTLLPDRLERYRAVAHTHGATVNDVLLTAVGAGLRALLLHRGEPVAGVTLRVSVPISLHDEAGPAAGNRDGLLFLPVPVDIVDPAERLARMAVASAAMKRRVFPAPSGILTRAGWAQRLMYRLQPRQHAVNGYVANVPGPPRPLWLAGAPVESVFPLVPLMASVPLAVGALSYAGQFNAAAIADPGVCPDVAVFAEAFRATIDALAGVAATAA